MRQRVAVLASLVAVAVLALTLAMRSAGVLDEPVERSWDALAPEPGVADGWVAIGMTDPATWDRYASDPRDRDRTRHAGLVETIRQLGRDGASLVVLTELVSTEDLELQDVEALLEVLRTVPVVPVFLDTVRVDSLGGATIATAFREPLGVTAAVPLAHGVVPSSVEVVRGLPLRLTHRTESGELAFFPPAVAAVLALGEGVDRARSQQLQLTDDRLAVGDLAIPVDEGMMRIAWSSRLVHLVPGSTASESASDDLPFQAAQRYLDAEGPDRIDVAGKVVLLGSVDPLTADFHRVPGGPAGGVPELWVHANALNTLLTDSHRVPVGALDDLGILVLMVALGSGLTARLPVTRASVWVVSVAVGFLVLVSVRLRGGALVDAVHPLVALGLAWLGTFLVRYAVEGRQRRRVAQLFRSYVPDTVAEQLIEAKASLDDLAAGQRVDITVLFCDLRGFTAHAATLEPPDVRDLLNVYYRHMAAIILERSGTVMQYVGDEVFAVFGAPLHQDDHAERAIEAATAMQAAAAEIAAELAGSGIAPIAYGIGVHSGTVVAAHVGDQVRRQYSVVGDTVNIGARLCSQAKAGEVVVSQDVVDRLPETGRWARGEVELSEITDAQMKGVNADFRLHRLRW